VIDKSFLNGMQVFTVGNPFYGCNFSIIFHNAETEAAQNSFAVNQNRTCAALPMITAFFVPVKCRFFEEHQEVIPMEVHPDDVPFHLFLM
jgi:hypothetical protein